MNNRRSTSRFSLAVGFILGALLLAGCSTSESAKDATSKNSNGSDEAKASKEETLEDFFGGDPAKQQAQFERRERERQTKVAKCMRDQGFDYTPFAPSAMFQIPKQPKPGEEVAFKRKNGYGFADSMAQSGVMQSSAQVDPNQKRMEKMNDADRNAYTKALYGFDEKNPPQNGQAIAGGCQNQGYAEQEAAWKPLNAKFEQFGKRVEADPEIAKLNSQFVGCMNKAGFKIAKEGDIFEKVLVPAQQKVWESMNNQSSDATGSSDTPPTPPTIPQAKIDGFRGFELKVANADADCRPQKVVNKLTELRKKYEKAFITENRALLEKVRE